MRLEIINKPKSARPLSAPARVLLRFIAGMLVVLLGSLLLGELTLPRIDMTVWDLGGAALSFGLKTMLQGLVLAAAWCADNFVFAAGALGLGWLTHIHLCVHKTGKYSAGGFDYLSGLLAVGLFLVYFSYQDQVLPINSSFFYRVTLYSAISVLSFGVVVLSWDVDAKVDARGGDWGCLLFIVAIVMLIAGCITGNHGSLEGTPFFAYRVLNAGMHLGACCAAYAMAAWFHLELDDMRTKNAAHPAQEAAE